MGGRMDVLYLEFLVIGQGIILIDEDYKGPPLSNDITCQGEFTPSHTLFAAGSKSVDHEQDDLRTIEAALSQQLSRFCQLAPVWQGRKHGFFAARG